MSASYLYIIIILIGGGIELFAFKKKNIILLRFALAVVTFASIILGLDLILSGRIFLAVLGFSFVGFSFLNWDWVTKRTTKAQKNYLVLQLFGSPDELEKYFPVAKEQSIGNDTEDYEIVTVDENTREGMFYEVKFEIDLLPAFVKPDWSMLLDVSPENIDKEGMWQLQVSTDFGISERLIRGFIETFNLWEKSEDAYYKRDFKSGRLIHVFEFPADKCKLWHQAG